MFKTTFGAERQTNDQQVQQQKMIKIFQCSGHNFFYIFGKPRLVSTIGLITTSDCNLHT